MLPAEGAPREAQRQHCVVVADLLAASPGVNRKTNAPPFGRANEELAFTVASWQVGNRNRAGLFSGGASLLPAAVVSAMLGLLRLHRP